MATLKIDMPDGTTKSLPIGNMKPDDPRLGAIVDRFIASGGQDVPQPGLRERFGGAVQTGLDYATKGVEKAVDLSLTGDPLISEKGRAEAPGLVARGVVPQTPQDLLTTMLLGATNKIPGVGGALARIGVTAGTDVAGRYLTGEEQNPLQTALKTGVVGAVEGVGLVAPSFSKIIREKQREALGRQDAAKLGEAFAKRTNLKNLTTPENIANDLSGSKYINTPVSKIVSAHMQANETALLDAVKQAMRTVPQENNLAARSMLERTADVTPKNPMGFRGKDAPVIQQENTTDQLVEKTIDRLRHIREKINHAVDDAGEMGTLGVSTHDLYLDYDHLKDDFLAGLGTLHPDLKAAYQKMNEEYVQDFDLAKFLYKGRDTFLTSGQHSAKLVTPAFGDYVSQTVHDIRDKNLVADILKVTTRGGEFGAADQSWSVRPIVGGPKPLGSTIREAVNIRGTTPAGPRITSENMPPQGVYDIGALQGLMSGEDEYRKKGQ